MAELSVDDGAGATGGEGEGGVAHRAQGVTVMLKVLAVGQGALGVCGNSSPEFVLAAVGPGCCRGRCCGSLRSEKKARLDAQDQDKAVCVNEE